MRPSTHISAVVNVVSDGTIYEESFNNRTAKDGP